MKIRHARDLGARHPGLDHRLAGFKLGRADQGRLPALWQEPRTGPFGFTGQRIDLETNGLYYYRARHYSPVWGRFLQPELIAYAGGANRYMYVANDPLNLIDPSGLVLESIGQSYFAFGQGAAAEQQATTDYFGQHPYVMAAIIASPLVATGVGVLAEASIAGGGAGLAFAGHGIELVRGNYNCTSRNYDNNSWTGRAYAASICWIGDGGR